LKYKVRLSGNSTREQYEEVHKTVAATSPNYYNISYAINVAYGGQMTARKTPERRLG
jgi:hypothetical protein